VVPKPLLAAEVVGALEHEPLDGGQVGAGGRARIRERHRDHRPGNLQ
jgi:hypothetical protein